MSSHGTCLALVFLALAQLGARGARPSPEQLREYFIPAELSAPALSPTGEYLGCIVLQGDDYGVGVYSFAKKELTLLGGAKDSQATAFEWKGPRRLILHLTNRKRDGSALMAIDVDEKNPVDLWQVQRAPGFIIDGLPGDPRHVLKQNRAEVLLVDIADGSTKRLDSESDGWVFRLLADNTWRFRAAYLHDADGSQIIKWKGPGAADETWHRIAFKPEEHGFRPFGFDEDPRYLWVWDYSQGNEWVAARLDTVSGERTVVGRQPGYDATHALKFARYNEPIAVVYSQQSPMLILPLAEKYAAPVRHLQERFAGSFPTVVDCLADRRTWIVWAGNSRLPGAYFLFDSVANQSSLISRTHSGRLSEDRLVAPDQVSVKGRKGHRLRGLIWRPPGVTQPPLLVMCPTSMPGEPAMDLYDADVQALVACGLAVAKIDARGTFGYGETYLTSTDGYIKETLREDFEDFVRAVGSAGYVDLRRVGLFGEWLGGALALKLGATSETFSAIININAPPRISRNDLTRFSKESSTERSLAQMGGWSRSGQLATELSPLEIVPGLKTPSLHLYDLEPFTKGRLGEDGRKIKNALKDHQGSARVGLAYGFSEYGRLPSERAQDRANQVNQIMDFLEATWRRP